MFEIKVSGMTCGGCVNSVTKALKSFDSNALVEVSLENQLIKINSLKPKSEIANVIEEAGFSVLETKETV